MNVDMKKAPVGGSPAKRIEINSIKVYHGRQALDKKQMRSRILSAFTGVAAVTFMVSAVYIESESIIPIVTFLASGLWILIASIVWKEQNE